MPSKRLPTEDIGHLGEARIVDVEYGSRPKPDQQHVECRTTLPSGALHGLCALGKAHERTQPSSRTVRYPCLAVNGQKRPRGPQGSPDSCSLNWCTDEDTEQTLPARCHPPQISSGFPAQWSLQPSWSGSKDMSLAAQKHCVPGRTAEVGVNIDGNL